MTHRSRTLAKAMAACITIGVSGGVCGWILGHGNFAPGTLPGQTGLVAINPSAEPDAANHEAATGPEAQQFPPGVTSCGSERAAIKHLTDGFVLPATPTVMTIDQLVNMAAPPITASSPRQPVERQLVELQNVHVIAVKQEADSDIHVIVATPTGAELNVEAPMAVCDSSSPYAAQLAQARAAMDAAMPNPSTGGYTAVNLTATIEGVLFFDVLHGQRGAPNGAELHPVVYFAVGNTPPPPITTGTVTTGTTTTTPTTTSQTTATTTTATTTPEPPPEYNPEWPGCERYPHRVWYHGDHHDYCRSYFYKTP